MTKTKFKNLRNRIVENRISKKDIDVIEDIFFNYPNTPIIFEYDYMVVICEGCYDSLNVAIRLYQKRRCSVILLCDYYSKEITKDYSDFYNYAVSRGIIPVDILYDSNTYDMQTGINHVFRFLLSLNKLNPRVLFVARSIRLFRAKKIANNLKDKLYYFPHCDYYPSYHRKLNPDEWYLYKKTRDIIINEMDIILRNDLYD